MSPKIPSQDSVFEDVWQEMDEIEPLTPKISKCKGNCKCSCLKSEDVLKSYKEAAESDAYMFGEYDGYKAYDEGS